MISLWANPGVTPDRLALLSRIELRIANLHSDMLGANYGNVVWLDDDAAGYGWSTDESASGVDPVSVLAHEVGHALGFEHDIMGAHLDTGVQNLDWLYDLHDDHQFSHQLVAPVLPSFGSERLAGFFSAESESEDSQSQLYDSLAPAREIDRLLTNTDLRWIDRSSERLVPDRTPGSTTSHKQAIDDIFAEFDEGHRSG